MRIALVTSYLPSDSKMGVGYQVHYLANQLVGRGHTVIVFSRSPRPVDAKYEVRQVDVSPPMRSIKLSWQLRSIDWSEFDVLHAHGDDWFLWGRNVPPHIRTVHGSCLSEAWHIPTIKGKAYMLWLAMLETMSCAVADRVVGVSANTCRSYPWIRRVIPNGVDLSAFRPGKKESAPTILFVGTYENRKRGKWLMDLFSREVLPKIPDARLWMVCSDAPSAASVEVLGRLSTEDLADRYRRAWVFCLPSTYEGFGVPYIEAMASGTAVVTTHNAGSSEVLEGGKWGLLTNDEELSPSIIRVLEDSKERSRWEELGSARAVKFGWGSVVAAYEKLYEEVISRSETATAGKGSTLASK